MMKKTYKTRNWEHLLQTRADLDPAFARHLRDLARPHQIAYHRLMRAYRGNPVGVECKCSYRESWAFVSPNPQTAFSIKPYRVTYFDINGFIGHETYGCLEQAVEDMLRNYPTIDAGALPRCSQTAEWAKGLIRQQWRDKHIRGEITFKEMLAQISAMDSENKPIVRTVATSQ